jgi:hypothetical protein
MAASFRETTVAAPRMPFLRESVNAARGPGRKPGNIAAKVGNATFHTAGDTL